MLKFLAEEGIINIVDDESEGFVSGYKDGVMGGEALYEVTGLSRYFLRNFPRELQACNSLDELTEAIPDSSREDPADRLALKEAMSRFLSSLSKRNRQLFLCRYWYAMSVKECSAAFGLSESGVKTMLHRLRGKLKAQLEKEEIIV